MEQIIAAIPFNRMPLSLAIGYAVLMVLMVFPLLMLRHRREFPFLIVLLAALFIFHFAYHIWFYLLDYQKFYFRYVMVPQIAYTYAIKRPKRTFHVKAFILVSSVFFFTNLAEMIISSIEISVVIGMLAGTAHLWYLTQTPSDPLGIRRKHDSG